jgi:hypothetical protein
VPKTVADNIHGYTYGDSGLARSPVSLDELESLKVSAAFTAEDERYLRLAGEVLGQQTEPIVALWRGKFIAGAPHLARHARSLEGGPLPDYSANSGLRLEQWILDTCFRPYDQDWLDYQHEIALRHTSVKKNQTDGVQSTPYIPLRDIVAFIGVMNETIKPFLAAKGDSAETVSKMHDAWCKSMQLQMALWAKPYMDGAHAANEW